MKLHPAIVHFPIALLCTTALFALLSLFVKKELFKEITFWNLILGVVGTIAAVISGLIEESRLAHNEQIHDLLVIHKFNGIIILIVSLILVVWLGVRNKKMQNKEYITWVLFTLLAVGLVFYEGFLGGKMVFELGAGVKPIEQQFQQMEEDDTSNVHEHNENNPTNSYEKTDSSHLDSSKTNHSKMKMKSHSSTDKVNKKKELKDMKY